MEIAWGLDSVLLAIMAQAMLHLSFHHGHCREWEACVANAVLGWMITGSAAFLGAMALGL